MKIINIEKLIVYAKEFPDSGRALNRWIKIMQDAKWESHNDLKRLYPSADYVGNSRYVFNIRGNNYRLITVIVFFAGYVDIRFIGRHKEYDKINCTTI